MKLSLIVKSKCDWKNVHSLLRQGKHYGDLYWQEPYFKGGGTFERGKNQPADWKKDYINRPNISGYQRGYFFKNIPAGGKAEYQGACPQV